jgi:long-chain acyl-CoA synthetase
MIIEDLYELGERPCRKGPEAFESLVDEGKADDVCHLCLTSGTTGLSKGAMMTHKNYINMGVQITDVDPWHTDEYLSFLPFAWIGEQMNSFGVAMATGITINFPESVETAMEDLKEIGPHFMFGAPRIYETIRSQIWLKIDESYWLNRKSTITSSRSAKRRPAIACRANPCPRPEIQGLAGHPDHLPAPDQPDRPAAPAPGLYRRRGPGPELFTFYQAIGVNLKQIYGQTEIVGIAYMHRDGDVRRIRWASPCPTPSAKFRKREKSCPGRRR